MKGELSVSRPQYGDGRKKIKIEVRDDASRVSFLEIEIDLDKFAACVTGLSCQEIDFDVRSLDVVGKTKETKPFTFKVPKETYRMKVQDVIDIGVNLTPEGWTMSRYFGSQDSFFSKEGTYYANTHIYRYV